jgi:hypothetical protein
MIVKVTVEASPGCVDCRGSLCGVISTGGRVRGEVEWVLVAVTSALTSPQMWEIDGQTVVRQAVPYVYHVEVPASEFR